MQVLIVCEATTPSFMQSAAFVAKLEILSIVEL
jgi:hypothetical protein